MLSEIITKATQTDPSHSDWCVDGQDVTVWVDASLLVTGVVIENGRSIAEDTSWLRPVHEDRHINMTEIDAVLWVINLA